MALTNYWLDANTILCRRLSARITEETCLKNRTISAGQYGDHRCEGCGGLFDQPEAVLHLVASIPDEEQEAAFELEEDAPCRPDIYGAVEALNASSEVSDFLAYLPDDIAQEVAAIFSDDEKPDPDEDIRADRWKPQPPRKVAVFVGRCPRCRNYMVNDREWQFGIYDEEIYRCFSCGYRTSPVYQFNRNHRA